MDYLNNFQSFASTIFNMLVHYSAPLRNFVGISKSKLQNFAFFSVGCSDVNNLTMNNLKTLFDGYLWIITRRHKSDIYSNIRLLEVPKRIIENYKGYRRDNRLFPMPDNSTCN